MKQFHENVLGWSVTDPEHSIEHHAWYVQVGEETAVIDPLEPNEELLRLMEVRGTPDCVILTNWHQTRAAEAFRDLYDCPIWIHEDDEHRMEIPVDRTFSDGDILSCGLQVVQLHHQKTPGESALYLPASPSLLIVGDALVGAPKGFLSMLPHENYENAQDARVALSRLLELEFDALLMGHGEPLREHGHALLKNLLSDS